MCGIGGILLMTPKGPRHDPVPEEWLNILAGKLAHRGPDGTGRFQDSVVDAHGTTIEVALIHTRLSIIDHSGGHQPMVSREEDGTVAVIFNGCIYNHHELRRRLRNEKGAEFQTDHSDTESIVQGVRHWGGKTPRRLEGMFAFGAWDSRTGTLLLARDRAGEKPLYVRAHTEPNGRRAFFFASTIPALRALMDDAGWSGMYPGLEIVDMSSGWPYAVVHGFPHRSAPLGGAFAIPPAHALLVGAGHWPDEAEPRTHPYWKPPTPPDLEPHQKRVTRESVHQNATMVDDLLRQSVQARLESDAPLGCFLSGGIDSSLVASYAREALGSLRTFCIKMPDERYDESPYAAEVAHYLGTTHQTLNVHPRPAEDLVALIDELGMPFGDSSILPTYWVSKAARRHVKVALSGDGGDELFGGYERYRAVPLMNRFSSILKPFTSLRLGRGHPKSKVSKAIRLAHASTHGGYMDLLRIFPTPLADRLFQRINDDILWEGPIDQPVDTESGAAMFDFLQYLPEDLLRKVDTASMSVALEVRCPMLDTNLINAVLSMPFEHRVPDGQRKGLLKPIAESRLPAGLFDRPKMGFAIPISQWFRNDHGNMRTLLLDTMRSREPFGDLRLQRQDVDGFIKEHMEGLADHGERLFSLLTLALWAKTL